MQSPQLIEMFRSLASEITERDFSHVQSGQTISELGIDSLQMLELIGEMERELDIHIPEERLVGLEKVQQLLSLVDEIRG